MAGKIVGSVEHFITSGISSGSCKLAFVSAFRFLNEMGPQIGVKLVAWNRGTAPLGSRGTWSTFTPDYYDQPGTAGENAWACFRFTSASYPFDVFMQWTFTTTWSDAFFQNSTGGGAQCGFSMCARRDTTDPWNGTTFADGTDTKGTPLFVTSSLGGIYFPISNDSSITVAAHAASGKNLTGLDTTTSNDLRCHYLADKDGMLILWDDANDGSYAAMYIGEFSPFTCANMPHPLPLCAINGVIPWAPGTQYGTPTGVGGNQGAILILSGTVSGSSGISNDRYDIFFANTLAQPNHAYTTPAFNEMPLAVGAISSSGGNNAWRAFLGFIDTPLCRETFNMSTHDTNDVGNRAVFGGTTAGTVKLSVPFHSGTTPGSGVTQQGTQFTIP